ncbi:hypothetical protein [Brevundimonas sp. SL130]|uniref:hypothetical protein n=1 Tax=Brevundimonas sp. SL130 TaxID=2995143 RepID=UPI00226D0212|nr:hypothetical protein [Brevundimonas sp. SL130]WAC61474.1 hypothetical protein OU998_08565 [Brevundimonas sp. SL130]
MGFVTTEGRGAVRFDEIVRHWAQGDMVHFTNKAGDDFTATAKAWSLCYTRELISVIPAQPGTYQLEWCEQDDDGTMGWDQMPVLAWGIGLDGYAMSIGGDGIDEYSRAVLHPSGQVTKGTLGSWPSFEAFQAACQEHEYLRN